MEESRKAGRCLPELLVTRHASDIAWVFFVETEAVNWCWTPQKQVWSVC